MIFSQTTCDSLGLRGQKTISATVLPEAGAAAAGLLACPDADAGADVAAGAAVVAAAWPHAASRAAADPPSTSASTARRVIRLFIVSSSPLILRSSGEGRSYPFSP